MNVVVPPGKTQFGGEEVLQTALAKAVRTRSKDTSAGKCRVSSVPDPSGSGFGKGSGKPKMKIALAKKTQVELRHYGQQFKEAKQNEHTSWVDNDVYELIYVRRHPAKRLPRDDGSLQSNRTRMANS